MIPNLLPNARESAGFEILEDVASGVRGRMGGRLFAMYGPFPWSRERMQQIVRVWLNEWDQAERERENLARFHKVYLPPPAGTWQQLLRAYLISISNRPYIEPDVRRTFEARERFSKRPPVAEVADLAGDVGDLGTIHP